MIGRLSGTVISCGPDRVLLDVAGVGYEVAIPLSTFYALPREEGARASLRIHTHVREDALQLYGFGSEEERSVFELLIGISGVGPRMALGILSGIGAEELRTTVAQQDRARLQKIPGVGKKTAERLLLELRDRLEAGRVEEGGGAPAGRPQERLKPDAVSALVNLGYSKDVSERAVERALERPEGCDNLEGLLRAALAGLVR